MLRRPAGRARGRGAGPRRVVRPALPRRGGDPRDHGRDASAARRAGPDGRNRRDREAPAGRRHALQRAPGSTTPARRSWRWASPWPSCGGSTTPRVTPPPAGGSTSAGHSLADRRVRRGGRRRGRPRGRTPAGVLRDRRGPGRPVGEIRLAAPGGGGGAPAGPAAGGGRRGPRRPARRHDPRHGRCGVPRRDAGRRAAGERRPWAGRRHRRPAGASSARDGCGPPSTSPTPSRCPPDHPLWSAPGVLVTPHVGGDTSAFLPRAQRLVAAQLHRWLDGRPLSHVVVPGGSAGPGADLGFRT